MLLNNVINFLLEFFLFLVMRLNVMKESLAVLFFALKREFLLELFSFLNEIDIGGFFLCAFGITTNNERLSHEFLHFVSEIFLSSILQFIQFYNNFLH